MSKTSTDPAPSLRRFALAGPAMGSRWSAVFFADAGYDAGAARVALAAAVEEVEAQMSHWRPGSDVERLNRRPVGVWMDAPAALLDVLAAALEVQRLSGGAFDVGVGDLARAYGFGAGLRAPDRARIAACAQAPRPDAPTTLEIDRRGLRARRLAPLTLDLAGIAKGYGVDRMAQTLEGLGVAAYLVGIDGELRAGAAKPDGRGWAVGQEKPDPTQRALMGVLELTDAAAATSGDYRHVVEIDGRRVSHTMDPNRRAPVENTLAQVTVVAPRCMHADAWATAIMVAGWDEGYALARRLGLSAILVARDGATRATMAEETAA